MLVGMDEEPRYLKERGKAIWRSYGAGSLPAGPQALVHEYARLADALDKLDTILGARATDWARIVLDEIGEVTLEVNGLLGERRQHAMALRTLHAEIRAAGIQPIDQKKDRDETEGRGGIVLSLIQRAQDAG